LHGSCRSRAAIPEYADDLTAGFPAVRAGVHGFPATCLPDFRHRSRISREIAGAGFALAARADVSGAYDV